MFRSVFSVFKEWGNIVRKVIGNFLGLILILLFVNPTRATNSHNQLQYVSTCDEAEIEHICWIEKYMENNLWVLKDYCRLQLHIKKWSKAYHFIKENQILPVNAYGELMIAEARPIEGSFDFIDDSKADQKVDGRVTYIRGLLSNEVVIESFQTIKKRKRPYQQNNKIGEYHFYNCK